MMGLGSLGNGGSSSSSGLSPLAQPFTVDRPLTKSTPNPLVPLPEAPYSASLNHSMYSRLNSVTPNSRPDFFANPELEIDTTRLLSPKPYRFSNPLSSYSAATTSFPLNPRPAPAIDPFPYAQCSDSLVTTAVQNEPFHFQHVPPAVHENSPLVSLGESGYDLLPTSSVASMNGSYQDDYTQSLSALEYPSRWGGFWNGLDDRLGSKMTELEQCCVPEETNLGGSSIFKNYAKQDAAVAEDLSIYEQAPVVSDRECINTQGMQNFIGSLKIEQLHDKFFGRCPEFVPVELSKTSNLGSTSVFPKPLSETSSFQSISDSYNHPKPSFGAFHVKTSPAVVIRQPNPVMNSSATKMLASKNVSYGSNVTIDYSENCDGCSGLYKEDPQHPQGTERKDVYMDKSGLGIGVEGNGPVSLKSCAAEDKMSNDNFVTKEAVKAGPEFKFLHNNVPNIALSTFSAEAAESAEKSSENLEYYNPAVDSPCWKGAPASQLSPFDVCEDNRVKKLEACVDLDLQGPSVSPVTTDTAIKVCALKSSESSKCYVNEHLENGSSPSLRKPLVVKTSSVIQRLDDAAKAGTNSHDLSTGAKVYFPDFICETRKEYAQSSSKGEPDFKSQKLQAKSEEDRFATGNKLGLESDALYTRKTLHDAPKGDYMLFSGTECVSHMPSGSDVTVKADNPRGEKSSSKINVQLLVNAMQNLSELLLYHCSNEACTAKEVNPGALKNVIDNLDACILKNSLQLSKIPKFVPSRQDPPKFFEDQSTKSKGIAPGQPLQIKEAAALGKSQHDPQCAHDLMKDSTMAGKNGGIFSRDVPDISNHDDMTKAIKDILLNNFHNEDDSQNTLLYKNLWLEAEAALCSTSYRARFDRIKTEMRNREIQEVRGMIRRAVDEPDYQYIATLANYMPSYGSNVDDDANDNDDIGNEDDDASVMARLHILKCRGANTNSVSIGGQPLPNTIDHGSTVTGKYVSLDKDRCDDDGWLNSQTGPSLERNTKDHTEGMQGSCVDDSEHEAINKSRFVVMDDSVIVSSTDMLQMQLPAGCYDNSSSEWEHVPKESSFWQNGWA